MPPSKVPTVVLLHFLNLTMVLLSAAWIVLWILKPTQPWKHAWHVAEDHANESPLRDDGLTIIVFCFPVLGVAALGFVSMHMVSKDSDIRERKLGTLRRVCARAVFTDGTVGIVSFGEILAAAVLFIVIVWTYSFNVTSDLRKMTPYAFLRLSRWELRLMHMGVRLGSLSELCLAILYLPILRAMSIFRIIGVQFEVSVRYHVWIANAMIFFSAMHGLTITSIWSSKGILLKEVVSWPRTGRVNIAGALALLTAVVIWVTSLPWLRQKHYRAFYVSHHLHVVFVLLFLLHVGDKHFYLVLANVLLFVMDKILRTIHVHRNVSVISARILPCNAIELHLAKHDGLQYGPTSIVFLGVPSISKLEWHPFTITSSCRRSKNTVSVLVKTKGQWTESLYQRITALAQTDGSKTYDGFSVAVDGPYGPIHLPYRRYHHLVLVAGGSGITPFLSILQEIAADGDRSWSRRRKITLIYCVKRPEDLSMLSTVSCLFPKDSSRLESMQMKIFITQGGSAVEAYEFLTNQSNIRTVVVPSSRSSGESPMSKKSSLLQTAALVSLCPFVFLATLMCLNTTMTPMTPGGRTFGRPKMASWAKDMLVIVSFLAAVGVCIAVGAIEKWKKKKGDVSVESENSSGWKAEASMVKHEITIGGRPNLAEIIGNLVGEENADRSEVGVFTCGPGSMKTAVASALKTKGLRNLDFHSLNFSL